MVDDYRYAICIDGQEVWRGNDLKNIYIHMKKKNPDKRVSIICKNSFDIPSFVLL